MTQPVLLLVAGPNGSGKTTLVESVLQPTLHLPFVNADRIAASAWPGDELRHAYEASRWAAQQRDRSIDARESLIAETVFSHPSKLDLIVRAQAAGYLVNLHVLMVAIDATVARVEYRVAFGGHAVPEQKIRERYERLWSLVVQARRIADTTRFYDNSRLEKPFSRVAEYARGRALSPPRWPRWTPTELL